MIRQIFHPEHRLRTFLMGLALFCLIGASTLMIAAPTQHRAQVPLAVLLLVFLNTTCYVVIDECLDTEDSMLVKVLDKRIAQAKTARENTKPRPQH